MKKTLFTEHIWKRKIYIQWILSHNVSLRCTVFLYSVYLSINIYLQCIFEKYTFLYGVYLRKLILNNVNLRNTVNVSLRWILENKHFFTVHIWEKIFLYSVNFRTNLSIQRILENAISLQCKFVRKNSFFTVYIWDDRHHDEYDSWWTRDNFQDQGRQYAIRWADLANMQ